MFCDVHRPVEEGEVTKAQDPTDGAELEKLPPKKTT